MIVLVTVTNIPKEPVLDCVLEIFEEPPLYELVEIFGEGVMIRGEETWTHPLGVHSRTLGQHPPPVALEH